MKTIERQCDLCGATYQAKVWYVAKNKNIFCSRNCAQKSHAKRTTAETFWKQVEKKGPDECWLFTGRKNEDGYGQIGYHGQNTSAHRVSYIFEKGEIPKGFVVMHTCDNPPCVNPRHLKLGTQQQNIEDMVKKGRHRNGGRGAACPNSVLTLEQRKEIRKRFTGIKGQKSAMAIEYGCCVQTICNVLLSKYA